MSHDELPAEIAGTHYVCRKFGLVTQEKLFRRSDMARLQPKSSYRVTWDGNRAHKKELEQKSWGSRGYRKIVGEHESGLEKIEASEERLVLVCQNVILDARKSVH